MAEDRWTGQVESWQTGWPSAISPPVRFQISPEWRSKIETFTKAMHHFVELLPSPFFFCRFPVCAPGWVTLNLQLISAFSGFKIKDIRRGFCLKLHRSDCQ